MKKLVTLLCLTLVCITAGAQDTFSIVAVDSITGEIGGAGASCIDESAIQGGVLIINDIIPGRGAIHTQSYWNATNQQNAHNRMLEWMSPQEIIDWLITHDAQNNPGIRQYGIVDFDFFGHPRSAAFTGQNCLNYKNHITGPNYAIQGNILLGQQILDSMEARFLNTPGMLAEKLMAALQGAKVPGADTRCMDEGVSSLSAFVRVSKPGDPAGTFFCDLLVPSRPYGVDPIDSLQVLFDQWLVWAGTEEEPYRQPNRAFVYPNPAGDQITFTIRKGEGNGILTISIVSLTGQVMDKLDYSGEPLIVNTAPYPPGIYFYSIFVNGERTDSGKMTVVR